jgi:starch synthase (maltosyl-transferring)
MTSAPGGIPVASSLGPVPDNDTWRAAFVVDVVGRWEYTVEAWVDSWTTWASALWRKWEPLAREDGPDGAQLGAGTELELELELRAGAILIAAAAGRAAGGDRTALRAHAEGLGGTDALAARAPRVLDPHLNALMRAYPDRGQASTYLGTTGARPGETPEVTLAVTVDPVRAAFSSWYEMFPRSCGPAGTHGTLRDAARRLDYVADMGFDVIYLPPIHPIGRTHRKGPDNRLHAEPGDPGSPWAIGAAEGGHTSLHPALGTIDDFRFFVGAARQRGLEVALDIALQASPDHPYVREHPEWFGHRPDGSIQVAENPPKKYEDIFPFDFWGAGRESLWLELRDIFFYWIGQGVHLFRVDNPHTKPIAFWEWCLTSIKARHPEVIFLAEAFTRPKLMNLLAKVGFSQSYTYFTWRTTKTELTAYVAALDRPDVREYFRPCFWPTTPDILPEELQVGTRATFIARAVLAATLSGNWGIYGPAFELQERVPRAGSEEYAQNEKYQLRTWDLERADSLRPVLRRLNAIRRETPALQRSGGTVFHETGNDALLCYSRVDASAGSVVLVVVSLDPHHRQSGWLSLDPSALALLALAPGEAFQVHDLIGDARYLWQAPRAFVELDPGVMPAQIFRIRHRVRSEHAFEYFA